MKKQKEIVGLIGTCMFLLGAIGFGTACSIRIAVFMLLHFTCLQILVTVSVIVMFVGTVLIAISE